MNNRPLSISDFKNWFSEQQGEMSEFFIQEPENPYIGKKARTKVSEGKLLQKIETDDDPETMVQEFMADGGTVLAIEGKRINIEVESGEFSLPRFCVKVKKT
jgi:hypothetical protein